MWFAPAHHDELLLRWHELGASLDCTGNIWDREGRRLLRSWGRWPRRYHNTLHLRACLHHLTQVRGELTNSHAVELALWFHDAIYWPWRPLNEEKSALWATRFMREMGFDPAMCEAVNSHVLDTRHQAVEPQGDARWVVDIDLAILGQSETVYRQFERDVRSEYRWVRWSRYAKGRSAVLQSFVDRPRIYRTPWFFERYETSARNNLQGALAALSRNQLY
ncbi:MAG: HD domain-containing protein [Polaromonas sp.]